MTNTSNIFPITAILIASFLYSAPLYAMRASCPEDFGTQKVVEMIRIVNFSANNIVDLQNHLKTEPTAINYFDNNHETIIDYVSKNIHLNNHAALMQLLTPDKNIELTPLQKDMQNLIATQNHANININIGDAQYHLHNVLIATRCPALLALLN